MKFVGPYGSPTNLAIVHITLLVEVETIGNAYMVPCWCALGMSLLKGPREGWFLMSKVPLCTGGDYRRRIQPNPYTLNPTHLSLNPQPLTLNFFLCLFITLKPRVE
jgi:hypothetical protein